MGDATAVAVLFFHQQNNAQVVARLYRLIKVACSGFERIDRIAYRYAAGKSAGTADIQFPFNIWWKSLDEAAHSIHKL